MTRSVLECGKYLVEGDPQKESIQLPFSISSRQRTRPRKAEGESASGHTENKYLRRNICFKFYCVLDWLIERGEGIWGVLQTESDYKEGIRQLRDFMNENLVLKSELNNRLQ